MLTTLWTNRTGLNAQQEKLDIISKNMVNANTTGYKKVQVGFKSLLESSLNERGNPINDKEATIGSGVRTGDYLIDNTQGNLVATEQKTNLAVDGAGIFRVFAPDGTEYYTRDGNFRLDSDGRLVIGNGYKLDIQYDNGYSENNVKLTADNFTINTNGDILITENGQQKKVGEIPLYSAVGNGAFVSLGNSLCRATEGTQVYRTLNGEIHQGYLENSNVDLTQEMTEMIVTQRAFQLSSKGISTADEMWGMINNLR